MRHFVKSINPSVIGFIAALGLLNAMAAHASAQSYPSRPVRIIVPVAAGGLADVLARMLAAHLSNAMGQQFYVENRSGGGNVIGTEIVARAVPDGHTLLLSPGAISINHVVQRKLPYDVVRDFAPISQLVSAPNVLVVHASHNINHLSELIAAARRRPGELSYGSAGVGTSLHLSMELLKSMAGIDLVHIPYKGLAPAMSDLLGGHIALMMANVPSAKPNVDEGKLRAIGVSTAKRSVALPSVPSISEAGIAGYDVANWFGLFAPKGTPQDIITRLHAETTILFAGPETRQRLTNEGAEPVVSSPEAFAEFVKAEIDKWSDVGRRAKIQASE